MTTPVIPAWQLQQDCTEADNAAESRAEMKSSGMVLQNCDNCTDTTLSLTTSSESNMIGDQFTAGVKDKLEIMQPDIVQVQKV